MNWKYCPYCGGKLQKESDKSVCEVCHKQHFENPKSTVGVFLFDGTGRLVLATRGVNPHKGKWDTIGGFVNVGESLEEAARREIMEETGCILGVDTTEPEYIASTYIEVEFMGYKVPVNTIMFGARLIHDELHANDDVSGFVRVLEGGYKSEKMAWSKEMTPLIDAAFNWFNQSS